MRIGINGFGRIGRLSFRAGLAKGLNIVKVNDPGGDAELFAHLLKFDSVHGTWDADIQAQEGGILVNDDFVELSAHRSLSENDWSGCDLVIESSGFFRDADKLQAYFAQGVKKVIVSAPVKDPRVLNVVYGVNDHEYQADQHHIITAASCTTNCLAPVIKVLLENFGIEHASMTTIHSLTSSQSPLDTPKSDYRRARACGASLIPTSTGSAKAIVEIFPELKGRIDGHAVRVPLINASLTDLVVELSRDCDAAEVNAALQAAAAGELNGILGYEERPLVSIDYAHDPRSSIVDALSTMVVNKRQLKIYAWYDNEWGYSNRVVQIAQMLATR